MSGWSGFFGFLGVISIIGAVLCLMTGGIVAAVGALIGALALCSYSSLCGRITDILKNQEEIKKLLQHEDAKEEKTE